MKKVIFGFLKILMLVMSVVVLAGCGNNDDKGNKNDWDINISVSWRRITQV